ncbi:MAG: Hpt domain-containing protein [Magnetovibrio sp.]|nr:Hpt domain-containing protein [Magnetovibrio sp.]
MSDAPINLSKEIDGLRREFAEKLVERRARMEALVASIAGGEDADAVGRAIDELEELAHNLSGSGALFGYAELGAAAGDLEAACAQARAAAPVSAGHALAASWQAFTAAADAA